MNNDGYYKNLLKNYMADHDLNQAELAKQLGIQTSTMCNWLKTKHGISTKNRTKIERLCSGSQPSSGRAEIQRDHENKLILWYLDLPDNISRRGELLMLAATEKQNQ